MVDNLRIYAGSGQTVGMIFLIIGIVLAVVGLAIVLYIFVFSRNAYRRQAKELSRKYSYFDALLIGQDSQYIHRLEIISRTNLLYVEKYNEFARRFKEVFENDDKFAESMLKQLNSLIANNQFKNIKLVINDTRRAMAIFEESVNSLDADLFEVIKPEEEARQVILRLKEKFRSVKQIFFSNSGDLELVSSSFTKVFDKLDQSFASFETHIESAEYEEANVLIPVITNVVGALEKTLGELPSLCIKVQTVVPEKINEINEEYLSSESKGMPLFHLSYRRKYEKWNNELSIVRQKLINLDTAGAGNKLDQIQNEIEEFRLSLEDEQNDRTYFEEESEKLYSLTTELEKSFLKICSLLPEIKRIYVLGNEQEEQIKTMNDNMNKLGNSKRSLDNFIHSATKQPYSSLRHKLDDLELDYQAAKESIDSFKAYVSSLKSSCEEAYTLIFVYYYRLKQIESILHEMNIPDFAKRYEGQAESCYELLNDIYSTLKIKPINVAAINERVEQLKNIANSYFDDIENQKCELQLAESAIVYANRDRKHQFDVHQQLSILEKSFYQGEFAKVYHDATAIYQRSHVEDGNNAK